MFYVNAESPSHFSSDRGNCQNIVEIAVKVIIAITMINSTRTLRKVAA